MVSRAARRWDDYQRETCLDSVENNESCFFGGPPGAGTEPAVITGLHAQTLTLGIQCHAPAEEECITGATEHHVWTAMYGAAVTLSDPTPPTLSTPNGSLWEPGIDNGYHKGTESVTVAAQDTGGGVKEITFAVDGQPLTTYRAPCNFTYSQPCPLTSGPQTFTLDTASLPDGPHTLTLVATNAASDQSTIATQEITIENTPPPPPVDLTATPIQTGSTTFQINWSEPPGQTAPIITATYEICPASGSPCTPAAQASADGPATITLSGPGSWTISVWLTNAAGNTN